MESFSDREATGFSTRGTGTMVRRRIHRSRKADDFPDDFPQRPERRKQESGFPWAEIARRIGAYPRLLWRWRNVGMRPSAEHTTGLLEPADQPGLCRRFTRCSGGKNFLNVLDTEPSRSGGEPACRGEYDGKYNATEG